MTAGVVVIAAALGIRQTFGLFAQPLAAHQGITIGQLALAIAIQNLMWGIAQPFAGALSDRYGPGAVVAASAALYALGLGGTALHPTVATVFLGLGILVGLGQAGMTFAVVISAVSKAAPLPRRALAVALAAAGGSLGQVAFVPLAQIVIDLAGFERALLVLALLVIGVAPFGFLLARNRARSSESAAAAIAPWPAMVAALREPGYLFLTGGFFACGFNLAFVTTHLPVYLSVCHISANVSAGALATVGFFNVIGSYGFGRLSDRLPPQLLLTALYAARATAILTFALVPPTVASTMVFSVLMGLTWLGTVPLTNSVIMRLFGVGNLGVLFGACFVSHQIGAFLGVWGGGIAYEFFHSYQPMWTIEIAVSFGAALLNVPIRLPVQARA
ncbi:MAG: MFS transporter [Candidatus Eremiobacteraeota bacterium]|nr:MFS transporter [Candidatus Eremiobacteraeota bacterium]